MKEAPAIVAPVKPKVQIENNSEEESDPMSVNEMKGRVQKQFLISHYDREDYY